MSSLSLSWHSDNMEAVFLSHRMIEIRAWGKRCAFLRGRRERKRVHGIEKQKQEEA